MTTRERACHNGRVTRHWPLALALVLACGHAAFAQVPAGSTRPPSAPQPAVTSSADADLINPDRPGLADGSAVVGRATFQLETGFQQEFRKADGRSESTRLVPSLVRLGITDRLEFRLEGNTYTRVEDTTSGVAANHVSGFAPVSFGAKVQFQDGDGPSQPSLGAIVRVFPASGSDGFNTTRTTGDLRLAADWDISPAVSLNPNVGIASYEDENGTRFTTGLLALTLTVFNEAKTLSPFIDIGIQTSEGAGQGAAALVDAGVGYIIGRNVQLDISGGIGPHGATPPHAFFAVGLSIRFRASGS